MFPDFIYLINHLLIFDFRWCRFIFVTIICVLNLVTVLAVHLFHFLFLYHFCFLPVFLTLIIHSLPIYNNVTILILRGKSSIISLLKRCWLATLSFVTFTDILGPSVSLKIIPSIIWPLLLLLCYILFTSSFLLFSDSFYIIHVDITVIFTKIHCILLLFIVVVLLFLD